MACKFIGRREFSVSGEEVFSGCFKTSNLTTLVFAKNSLDKAVPVPKSSIAGVVHVALRCFASLAL